MRRLLLLRHAKTERDAPSGKDFDRRLDERGQVDALTLGAWLSKHPPLPDLVCVSTAVRAQQTWSQLAIGIDAARPALAAHLDEIYNAGPTDLLAVARAAAVEDPATLMIIGHNPGLHELALSLIGGGDAAGQKAIADNLPTSGLVVIDFDIADWGDVAFRGGKLVRFVSPKLLKGD
ncbi:SixA phosphatase family protein [Rhodopseudomonas sp. P2A-2r]|uniref:SixA phosphatase family protein n=1 Tax=unclassified Rhodopseudomonas TaxID=2638247 RepID=UPI002233F28F|nr:histidine phosphatase family protein [Rhodopseudomonas sp. P2A-2r]UZE51303.1 histidine phosphatase family protein [Rhodopseudomonas sp. P2A-2r]